MNLELETAESLYPFVLTEEQQHLKREIREFAARGNCTQRDGLGRSM